MNADSLVWQHLAWCEQRNLRPNYVLHVRRTLTRVEAKLGPLEHATEEDLAKWNAEMVETVSAAARGVYLSHLAGFYGWLILERLRADDPTARLPRPRLQRRLPRPIADGRLARALRNASGRVRVWLLLACYMGLRACEIAKLRADDLNADGSALIIGDGKGGKQRIVPVHPALLVELEQLPGVGWCFPHHHKAGRPVSADTVSQTCNRYLHKQEIGETLHQLRHWFGTNTYLQSQDLRLTQELMGHSSPQTTAGYAAWDQRAAAGVVGLLAVPEPEEAA